jgi:hypothetical protein
MNAIRYASWQGTKLTLITLFFTFCFKFASAQIPGSDSLLRQKLPDSIAPVTKVTDANIPKVNPQTEKDLRKYKAVYDSNFSPRKATIRSAIFPGLGQIYNHQYWKLPIVYGAVGTTAGIFFYNLKAYRDLRRSYILRVDSNQANDSLIPYRFSNLQANSLKRYRDEFRRNIDYSVLVFLLAWGLNVVDATVSAHLKQFDVSDDLSLKFKPILTPDGRVGMGLVMNFK